MSSISSIAGGTAMMVVGGAIAGGAAAAVWKDLTLPDGRPARPSERTPGMVTALGVPFGIGTGIGFACFGSTEVLAPLIARGTPTRAVAALGIAAPLIIGGAAAFAAFQGVSHLLSDD